jgi:AdoMet-dependent rRNA methyltransferase SPB1
MGKKKKVGKERLDKFYHLAKDQGYRSRAAFKLIQLNKKFNFLGKSNVLIDLCAAPGSWLQVATKFMPVSRLIIGVDLHPIKPIPNVITCVQDITTAKCKSELNLHLKGSRADVVLHDGAPNVGTSWVKDAYSQSELTLWALKLAVEFLAPGGTFVTKIFRSIDYNTLLWVFHQLFRKVSATKPTASRNTSAEIFVVCEHFLAPKKIDPKLLDPKVVFKDLSKDAPISLFSKKKKKKNQEGYDTDSILLFKKCSIIKLIHSEDPTKVLSVHNTIAFEVIDPEDDMEEISLYEQHPDTTDEIKECLKDLKVLNPKDFRNILKWRNAMRKFGSLEKEAESVQPVELTDEQKFNLMQQEIDDKIRKEVKRRKKKMRARLQKIQKMRLKLGISNFIEDEFEAPTDSGLFNISSIRKSETLNLLTSDEPLSDRRLSRMDEEMKILKVARKEEKPIAVLDSDSEYSDHEREHEFRTEKYLDMMYERYIKDNLTYRKKLAARMRKEKKKFSMPEDLTDFDKYMNMKELEDDMIERIDDEDEKIDNPLLVEPEKKITKRAALWFDSEIFDDVDDDDEGQNFMDLKTNNKRKLEIVSDTPTAKKPKLDAVLSLSSTDTQTLPPTPIEDSDIPFQEVAREQSDEEFSVDDYDIEQKAEILALGKLMHNPTSRHEVIESSTNRYMYPDDGKLVPEWFKDDEDKHNKPLTPLTKEIVAQYKEELKAINARSTKKVAEAKARKRKHYLDKLQKARQKAKAIASSDVTEREKVKQIQKLYKGQLSKVKPQKVYVVGKKRVASKNMPKGNVRMKLVDTRLKKDKRSRKAAEKRNPKRKKSRSSKSKSSKTKASK